MRLIPVIVVVVVAFISAGCAKSPQQVGFEPLINEAVELSGTSSIQFKLVDGRSDEIIGTRGGAYENSSLITLDVEALPQMRAYIETELEKSGFGIDGMGTMMMTVTLVTLEYQVEEVSSVKNNLKVTAGIQLKVDSGSSVFENSYAARTSMEVVGLASDAKNSEVINKALNLTINAMFRDEALNEFLN